MPVASASASLARVFVALWPDAATLKQLRAGRDKIRWSPAARPVSAATFHLTVQFIGVLERSALATVVKSLAMPVGEITLVLDRLRRFQGGAIALVGEAAVPLTELRQDVAAKLVAFGVLHENRLFKPHVTLGRDVAYTALREPEPVTWRSTGMMLVESVDGRYVPLAAWGTSRVLTAKS